MQFPQIIKDLERKKKNATKGTVMAAVTYDAEDNEYTIYTNTKLANDPFIKAMMMRVQEHISKNYSD